MVPLAFSGGTDVRPDGSSRVRGRSGPSGVDLYEEPSNTFVIYYNLYISLHISLTIRDRCNREVSTLTVLYIIN